MAKTNFEIRWSEYLKEYRAIHELPDYQIAYIKSVANLFHSQGKLDALEDINIK